MLSQPSFPNVNANKTAFNSSQVSLSLSIRELDIGSLRQIPLPLTLKLAQADLILLQMLYLIRILICF